MQAYYLCRGLDSRYTRIMVVSLLPFLVTAFFSLAVGFLTPLVWMERALLSLIWNVASPEVKDADVRRVHSAVHAVAVADGPTVCGFYLVVGMMLSVVQACQRGFDLASVLVAAVTIANVIYSVRRVGAVRRSARETDPAGEAGVVRAAIRKEMMFHYTGFIMCTISLILQMSLASKLN